MNFQDKPPSSENRATMTDVAAHAGVSIKSVSRVINNEPHVSPKLRLKIEAAIAALDYVPDLAARSLAGARSFEIGLLLGEMGPSYNSAVVAGVYRACIRHRYHLRLDTIPHEARGSDALGHLERILRGSRCDGFVVVPPYCDMPEVLDFFDARRIPYSLISAAAESTRAPGVRMDDAAAAAEIADLFWRLGHRRIGLLRGRAEHHSAVLRREGFLARLHKHDPALVVAEADGGFLFDQGIEAGLALLSRPDRPTAIFAANDDSAAGVISACNQLGLSVPSDVSICGFDDSWVAKSVWPHLTTVRQPVEAMAHAAACHLLERSASERSGGERSASDQGPFVVTMPYELIERGSTGAAP
jgi:LacI family transcriptional regulator